MTRLVTEIAGLDLLILVAIKQEMEELLQRPVDVLRYRETMNRLLKGRIQRDAVYSTKRGIDPQYPFGYTGNAQRHCARFKGC